MLAPAFAACSRFRVIDVAGRNWRPLVESPHVHAVAIAVPPAFQPEIALAALRLGKHLFCEKPLSVGLAAAAALRRAARRTRGKTAIDFEYPAMDTWRLARRLLRRGALGRVRHAVVSWQTLTRANRLGLRAGWKTEASLGGGALYTLVPHLFHNVEWLVGPVEELSCRLARAGAAGRCDAHVTLALTLRGGIPVTASVSANARLGTGHRVDVFCERGRLTLENPTRHYIRGFRLTALREGRGRVCLEDGLRSKGDERIPAVARVVAEFARRIDGRPSTAPTLEDGLRAQVLLEAARRSDASGRRVRP